MSNKGKQIKNSEKELLFEKRNYQIMIIGLIVIAFGYVLMSGNGANTTPEGAHDINYWNPEIFSWRRIRLAPIIICLGFVIEIYAIFAKPKNK